MFYGWRTYVPVHVRRQRAEREMARLRKKGHAVSPVVIEGRAIARTFWGLSWCRNLEGYSDYSNRLPRGRTYVRNGSVLDLQIAPGEVTARVSGSSLYKVRVEVAAVPKTRWAALCKDCAGGIDSLVELLQGRLSKGVMERICRQKTGLSRPPARSSSIVAAPIGPRCASTSRPCSTASAPGSMSGPSCSSRCARSTRRTSSPGPARTSRSPERGRQPRRSSARRASPRSSGLTSRGPARQRSRRARGRDAGGTPAPRRGVRDDPPPSSLGPGEQDASPRGSGGGRSAATGWPARGSGPTKTCRPHGPRRSQPRAGSR
jgi:hypothetical protein